MGGNALSVPSARISKREYQELENTVRSAFSGSSFIFYPTPILSYRTKDSFGDMDLLYSGDPEIIVPVLGQTIKVVEWTRNGSVTSVGVTVADVLFQLDFIFSSPENFAFSYNYYSWNDLGNLIGRLAHRVGLKFGHNGLWYVHRDHNGTRTLAEYLLSSNWKESIEYLGLDSERYNQGFDTPEDIYNFVISSPLFDYRSVDLARRNNVSRTRDRKRLMYNGFLKFLEERKLTEYNSLLKEKEEYLEDHFSRFPYFKESYYKTIEKQEKKEKISEKFNGRIVSEVTGLSGKDLGVFMAKLKDEPWYSSIIELDPAVIMQNIVKSYQSKTS